MGNNWYYTVIFYAQDGIADAVRDAFRCAERKGYRAVNPYSGRLTGMQHDGLEELTFETPQEAVDLLAAQGGLLEFWKGETAISISFEPPMQSETQNEVDSEKRDPAKLAAQRQNIPDNRLMCEISVIVDDRDLRIDKDGDDQERIMLARDVQWIFLDLCEMKDARYAYCTDEYLIEFFFYNLSLPIEEIKSEITETVRAKAPPAFLFWLQYFSNEYGEEARLAQLVEMGGTVRKLPKGFSVSFFQWPWEQQRSNKMESTNKQWRALYHGKGTAT